MAITKGKLRGEQVTAGIPNNQLPEVVLQATMENTLREFIRHSQENFEKSVMRLDVRHEGNLYESFSRQLRVWSGRITGSINFNFYGRFADMGVGKGVSLIERQTGRALTDNRNPSRILRKPKTWFTPIWIREQQRLGSVLARDVAKATTENLGNILPSGEMTIRI